MIYSIREYVFNNKNKNVRLKINNIRNKSEYVEGTISEVYERVFIVSSKDGLKRSFNYSDILTGNIEIVQ